MGKKGLSLIYDGHENKYLVNKETMLYSLFYVGHINHIEGKRDYEISVPLIYVGHQHENLVKKRQCHFRWSMMGIKVFGTKRTIQFLLINVGHEN